MIKVVSPFVPIYPWLDKYEIWRHGYYRIFPGDCRITDIGTPSDQLVDEVDLRYPASRLAALMALRDIGYPRPWALGLGFGSNLFDEQAGRAVAEMARRVGPDCDKPRGLVPDCVLLPWAAINNAASLIRRKSVVELDNMRFCSVEPRVRHGFEHDQNNWWFGYGPCYHGQAKSLEEAQTEAELCAQRHGALLWEEVTSND